MYVDSHCHLDQFDRYDEVIRGARRLNVSKIVTVSMDPQSSIRNAEISSLNEDVLLAVGIHPWKASTDLDLSVISELAKESVALGEIGLDHHFVKENWESQEKIFLEILEIAERENKPVIVHSKGAEMEVMSILSSFDLKVLIHWYSGPREYFIEGIDRGYFFSYNYSLKYSKQIARYCRDTPIEQILTESDGPVDFRGRRGSPEMIPEITRMISEIIGEDQEETKVRIFNNFSTFFNL